VRFLQVDRPVAEAPVEHERARKGHRLEIKPAADPRPAQHDGAGARRVADEELIEDFGADGPLGTPLGAVDGVVQLRSTAAQVDRLARRYGAPELLLALREVCWLKTVHLAVDDVGRCGGIGS
jgi:hypothetical protein